MTIITLPKNILSSELVAIPRNIYEDFLAWQELVKSKKTFFPSASEKKEIAKGKKEITEGKFVTLEEL